MHLRREKYVPKGGPDGGDGGRGGHVILRANPQFWTLIHLKYRKHIRAEHGGAGSGQLCKGKNGADVILDVPLGTVAKDAETGETLFELVEPGEERILVRGGRGGLGNNNFKSATNQTPRYAQPGEPGRAASQAVVHVELDRVRGHAEAGDFLHLQLDVRIDHGIGEHAALGQEGTVLVQVLQGLVQAVADGRDLRVLFRRQVVQVLGGGLARVDLVLDAVQAGHQQRGDRKSTRLNSSHSGESRMPSSA